MSMAYEPLTDDRGHEQQHQHCDVEDNDTQQQEEHSGGALCSAEFLQPKGIADPDPRNGLRHKLVAFTRLRASPKTAALRAAGAKRGGRGRLSAFPFNGNNALSASPQ